MKKKLLSLLLVSILVFMGLCGISASAEEGTSTVSVYSGEMDYDFWVEAMDGDVTEITIMTADQLMAFADLSGGSNFEGYTIKLGADMIINTGDASTWGTTPPAYAWKCSTAWANRFAGNFDGQGHVISGLYSNHGQEAGLFGTITGGNTIQNVSVVNSYFEYDSSNKSSDMCQMGGIVGYIDSWDAEGDYDNKTTTIKNVYVNATLYTDCDVPAPQNPSRVGVGGIIGVAGNTSNHSFVIENAVFEGDITSSYRNTGGLVGTVFHYNMGNVTMNGCSVNANISTTVVPSEAADAAYAGGAIGYLSKTALTLNNCVVTGTMKVAESKYTSAFIGGVNSCPDDASMIYRRVTVNNVLLAMTPVPTGENNDVIYQTMLFAGFCNGSLTANFNNVKYDNTIYEYPAELMHIRKMGGEGTLSGGDFVATGASTADLKGQDVFTYWTAVDGEYPVPAGVNAPVIDIDAYKGAENTAPSTPGEGENTNGSNDNGSSNNGSNNSGSNNSGSNNSGSNNNNGSNNDSGSSNTETTAPATDAPATDTPTTDTTADESVGCGSMVGFAGISVLALVAVMTIAISKKKIRN